MIYLIGGAPRVGKSTLASLILERNNISLISTDAIRGLLDYSPTQLGITNLEWNKRPEAFFPYFLQMLKILQRRYPDYVVEGDIFTPEQVSSIQKRIELKCCFIGMSYITLEDLKKVAPELDWVSKYPPEKQAQLPKWLIDISETIKKETTKYDFPYFDIYPEREKALEKAYEFLMK